MVYKTAINSSKQIFKTWKTGASKIINVSQPSGYLYRIEQWINTFWAQCSGTQCWLIPLGYLSTHGIYSSKDHMAHRHLENFLPWMPVSILAISTGSNHELKLSEIDRYQQIQNSLACTVDSALPHITPILRSLHWLNINECIEYKLK